MNVSSSSHADASILTCGNNRIEIAYDDLVAIDNWLKHEIPALNERVYKQAGPLPKFSLDNPVDPRYLAPYIEKANERSQKWNEAIEKAKANTVSSTRIGRLNVSSNALGETTVVAGSHSITMGAGAWEMEREACESYQRKLRVEQILKVFGEYPRATQL
jgi:hypothetical protein